jgi:hypothetical protein
MTAPGCVPASTSTSSSPSRVGTVTVVPSAAALVRLHAHEHVEVPGRTPSLARVPVAGEPDALIVCDPGRHVDLELSADGLATTAVAFLARHARGLPLAHAGIAHLGADDLPEGGARDRSQLAGPVAPPAGVDRRAGLGAVAIARLAHPHALVLDLHGGAARSVVQAHLGLHRDVAALHGALTAAAGAERVAAAEERVEDVAERAESLERRVEPARAQALVAVAVVDGAPLAVGEDLVGLCGSLELLLGVRVVRVHVRMKFASELPEGLLDVLVGGLARNAEDLVRVGLHSS